MKKPTYQFQGMVKGEKSVPVRKSFMEAWNDMYQWVKAQLDANSLSYQVLETAIWIEIVSPIGAKTAVYFYDARDRAISEYGWTQPK
jgi:hypothetical protein